MPAKPNTSKHGQHSAKNCVRWERNCTVGVVAGATRSVALRIDAVDALEKATNKDEFRQRKAPSRRIGIKSW
jgi:hypothetical protein